MIDRPTFVREFSDLLKRKSKARNRIIDTVVRNACNMRVLKKFALNNPEIIDALEKKRDVPVEKIRSLGNSIYNLLTDKKEDTKKRK